MMATDERLASTAYDLCIEVREAVFQFLSDEDLVAELRRRCPGYIDDQYRQAVAQGMLNSR